MTYMWQEERGVMIFRFQTDEKSVADKMKRRKNFKCVGIGLNCPLWIFVATFYSPQKSKNALNVLTGRIAHKNEAEGVFYA